MIKKITLSLMLFFIIISCGRKGDPEYIDPKDCLKYKDSETKKECLKYKDPISGKIYNFGK
tara:strand:- start:106 stop:288 length:183 start_codon:yes stop_codon:yes gene_type:complete